MRIALLHPTYWPEVRRGSERLAHDLGATLARRGHQVTLLTSHGAPTTEAVEDGVVVERIWRPPRPPGLRRHERHIENAPALISRLARGSFDVAHAMYASDGWAAAKARPLGGPPFLFSVHGILDRPYLVARRKRVDAYRAAAGAAGATSALSEAAAEPIRRYAIAAEPLILTGGVLIDSFSGPVTRPAEPVLLSPASLVDPRKRGEVLLEAFERLRRDRPTARLLLAGGADPFSHHQLDSAPPGVESIDLTDTKSLASAYRSASATVLASVHEAFGLVLVESLASGTPVVAARSGDGPEVVCDPAVGRLFEPDDPADLARAIDEALGLAGDEATVGACREQASRWDWERVVESYEAAYEGLLATR
jgi:glycosyltransferase involved in cell wall biosynthesis